MWTISSSQTPLFALSHSLLHVSPGAKGGGAGGGGGGAAGGGGRARGPQSSQSSPNGQADFAYPIGYGQKRVSPGPPSSHRPSPALGLDGPCRLPPQVLVHLNPGDKGGGAGSGGGGGSGAGGGGDAVVGTANSVSETRAAPRSIHSACCTPRSARGDLDLGEKVLGR